MPNTAFASLWDSEEYRQYTSNCQVLWRQKYRVLKPYIIQTPLMLTNQRLPKGSNMSTIRPKDEQELASFFCGKRELRGSSVGIKACS